MWRVWSGGAGGEGPGGRRDRVAGRVLEARGQCHRELGVGRQGRGRVQRDHPGRGVVADHGGLHDAGRGVLQRHGAGRGAGDGLAEGGGDVGRPADVQGVHRGGSGGQRRPRAGDERPGGGGDRVTGDVLDAGGQPHGVRLVRDQRGAGRQGRDVGRGVVGHGSGDRRRALLQRHRGAADPGNGLAEGRCHRSPGRGGAESHTGGTDTRGPGGQRRPRAGDERPGGGGEGVAGDVLDAGGQPHGVRLVRDQRGAGRQGRDVGRGVVGHGSGDRGRALLQRDGGATDAGHRLTEGGRHRGAGRRRADGDTGGTDTRGPGAEHRLGAVRGGAGGEGPAGAGQRVARHVADGGGAAGQGRRVHRVGRQSSRRGQRRDPGRGVVPDRRGNGRAGRVLEDERRAGHTLDGLVEGRGHGAAGGHGGGAAGRVVRLGRSRDVRGGPAAAQAGGGGVAGRVDRLDRVPVGAGLGQRGVGEGRRARVRDGHRRAVTEDVVVVDAHVVGGGGPGQDQGVGAAGPHGRGAGRGGGQGVRRGHAV